MLTYLRPAALAMALAAGFGGRTLAADPQRLPPPPAKARIVQDLFTTQDFDARVSDYVRLHRMLEGPPQGQTLDMERVRRNARGLAARLQRARPDARQGDIITPDVARMFRRRIVSCLSPEAWAAIFAEMVEDERGRPVPPLHVNAEWPADVLFNFVPPQLLMALPPLPSELQYRIVGRSLVLWDHHANLVVDFLPGAFLT